MDAMINERIKKRLEELAKAATKIKITTPPNDFEYIDNKDWHRWVTSALNLLKTVFGEESVHYQKLELVCEKFSYNSSGLDCALGVFLSAQDDFNGGYLFDIKISIQAEVFDDFLEQSNYLLRENYYQPAAVIAGSVLEDGLRKLCLRNAIPITQKAKLDTMNVGLAKKGTYNKLTQKKVTALADLRNKAAHGKWNEFDKTDVKEMIQQIRSFMEKHFS